MKNNFNVPAVGPMPNKMAPPQLNSAMSPPSGNKVQGMIQDLTAGPSKGGGAAMMKNFKTPKSPSAKTSKKAIKSVVKIAKKAPQAF